MSYSYKNVKIIKTDGKLFGFYLQLQHTELAYFEVSNAIAFA